MCRHHSKATHSAMHIIASLNHLVKLLPTDQTAYSHTPYAVSILEAAPSDAVALVYTSSSVSQKEFRNPAQQVRGVEV